MLAVTRERKKNQFFVIRKLTLLEISRFFHKIDLQGCERVYKEDCLCLYDISTFKLELDNLTQTEHFNSN